MTENNQEICAKEMEENKELIRLAKIPFHKRTGEQTKRIYELIGFVPKNHSPQESVETPRYTGDSLEGNHSQEQTKPNSTDGEPCSRSEGKEDKTAPANKTPEDIGIHTSGVSLSDKGGKLI